MSATELLPFAKQMGLEIIETTPERAAAQIKIKPELCNRSKVAAGGLIMALADALGTMLTTASLADGAHTVSIDSNTNFILPVPEGEMAHVECTLIYNEQKRMVWQTKITLADGQLAAVVSQTQLIYSADR